MHIVLTAGSEKVMRGWNLGITGKNTSELAVLYMLLRPWFTIYAIHRRYARWREEEANHPPIPVVRHCAFVYSPSSHYMYIYSINDTFALLLDHIYSSATMVVNRS